MVIGGDRLIVDTCTVPLPFFCNFVQCSLFPCL